MPPLMKELLLDQSINEKMAHSHETPEHITASLFIDTEKVDPIAKTVEGWMSIADIYDTDELHYVWKYMYTDTRVDYSMYVSFQTGPVLWGPDIPLQHYTIAYPDDRFFVVCDQNHNIVRVVRTCTAWSDDSIIYVVDNERVTQIVEMYHGHYRKAIFSQDKCERIEGDDWRFHIKAGSMTPLLEDVIA